MWKKILTILLTASVVVTAVPVSASVLTTSGDENAITASSDDVSGLTTDSESESVSNSISISQDGSSITVDSTDDAIMTDDSESDEEDSDAEDEDDVESEAAEDAEDSGTTGSISVTESATDTDTGTVSDGVVEVTDVETGTITAEDTEIGSSDEETLKDFKASGLTFEQYIKRDTIQFADELSDTDKVLVLKTVFFDADKFNEAKTSFNESGVVPENVSEAVSSSAVGVISDAAVAMDTDSDVTGSISMASDLVAVASDGRTDIQSNDDFVYDMADSWEHSDIAIGGEDPYPNGFLSTSDVYVPLQDSDDEDYYEADLKPYINFDGVEDVDFSNYVFSFGSNCKILFDDAEFDPDTEIVKIPKKYFDEETVQKNIDTTQDWAVAQRDFTEYARIQSQVAMRLILPIDADNYDPDENGEINPESSIKVTVDSRLSNVEAADETVITGSALSAGFVIPVTTADTMKNLKTDDIHIYINGSDEESDVSFIPFEDGSAAVMLAPVNVSEIRVQLGDAPVFLASLVQVPMKVRGLFGGPRKASAKAGEPEVQTYDSERVVRVHISHETGFKYGTGGAGKVHWSTSRFTMKFLSGHGKIAEDQGKFKAQQNAWCITPSKHTTPIATFDAKLVHYGVVGDQWWALRKAVYAGAVGCGTWNNGKGGANANGEAKRSLQRAKTATMRN